MKTIAKLFILASCLFSYSFAYAQNGDLLARIDVAISELNKIPNFKERVQKVSDFNTQLRVGMQSIPQMSVEWGLTNEFVTYLDQVEQVSNQNACAENLRILNELGSLDQRPEADSAKAKLTPMALQAQRVLRAVCL